MVYDVTRKDSFYGLKKWHEELIQNSSLNISKCLIIDRESVIGNKIDLIEEGGIECDVPEE